MKALAIAIAALLGAASGAEAKCSIKSLNGSWMFWGPYEMKAADGVLTVVQETTWKIKIDRFNSKTCRGHGTMSIGSVVYPTKVATEAIPRTTTAPNHMLVSFTDGTDFYQMELRRK